MFLVNLGSWVLKQPSATSHGEWTVWAQSTDPGSSKPASLARLLQECAVGGAEQSSGSAPATKGMKLIGVEQDLRAVSVEYRNTQHH
eukprot:2735932-Amphidinium_carterae.1